MPPRQVHRRTDEGALRARAAHVDIAPASFGGGTPLRAGDAPRVVTAGDILRMNAEIQAESA